MDTKKYLDSDWLKAKVNVQDGDHIRYLDEGANDVDRDGKDRLIVLVGVVKGTEIVAQKKFQVNKTNLKATAAMYGFNTKGWIGKEMRVNIVKKPDLQGRLVDAVALSSPNTDANGDIIQE